MHKRKQNKLIHEGKYAAEVEIEMINNGEGWAPYMSLDDALRLDKVREALLHDDIEKAQQYATQIYLLKPVAA